MTIVLLPLMILEKIGSVEMKLERRESDYKLKRNRKRKKFGSIWAKVVRLVLGFQNWDFSIFEVKSGFKR